MVSEFLLIVDRADGVCQVVISLGEVWLTAFQEATAYMDKLAAQGFDFTPTGGKEFTWDAWNIDLDYEVVMLTVSLVTKVRNVN